MLELNKIINRLQPSEGNFLKLVSQHIDDEMLREIAGSDYGYGADESFKELAQIRAGGQIDEALSWSSEEVLTLYLSGAEKSKRGYWKAIFSIIILMRNFEHNREVGDEDQQRILSLLVAMENTGMRYAKDALQFFAWYAQSAPTYLPNYLFAIFAMIWISVKQKDILEAKEILKLIELLNREEETYRQNENSVYYMSDEYAYIWLVGFSEFRAKHWIKFIQRMESHILEIELKELKHALNNILDSVKI